MVRAAANMPDRRRLQSPVRERWLRRAGRILRRAAGPLAGLALLAVSAWGAAHYALHSEAFVVRRVEVRGGERTPARAFEELLRREASGKNIFLIPLEDLRRRVEEHPWVRRARLFRMPPDGLRLVVEEPVPTAVDAWPDGEGRERMTWMDEQGGLIEAVSDGDMRGGLGVPLLVGLGGDAERMERAASAARFLHRLRAEHEDFMRRIATLDLSQPGRMLARLRDYDGPLYLDAADPERNMENFESVEAAFRRRHPAPLYVDLRWKNQIVVMPSAPAGGSQP